MNKIAILFFALSAYTANAQIGENVYPFLNIPVSARQAALGGDAVSIRDKDINFAAINPALLNEDMHQKISLNAATYLADTKYGTLNYGFVLENGHMLTANARFIDYGKIPRTDEAGFQNGEFGAFDASIGAGYAYNFEKEWTIGANLNYINAKIDNYTSMAISGSLGVVYHLEKSKSTIGIVARNFGYQFQSFNGTREDLPFRIDLGYTQRLKKFPAVITVTAHDLQTFDISSEFDNNEQKVSFTRKIIDHLSFGAEFFPESSFKLRVGYNVKRGNELSVMDQRSFSGLSAGFAVRFNTINIEFSHSRYHSASNMNMLGISLDMSGKRFD